jgi:hypothetical protein
LQRIRAQEAFGGLNLADGACIDTAFFGQQCEKFYVSIVERHIVDATVAGVIR